MVRIITEDFEYESYGKCYHCYGAYTQSAAETGTQDIFLYVMDSCTVSSALPYRYKYSLIGIGFI